MYNRLARSRDPSIEDEKLTAFDTPHETKRKLQLDHLLSRTKALGRTREQVCVCVCVCALTDILLLVVFQESATWLWHQFIVID